MSKRTYSQMQRGDLKREAQLLQYRFPSFKPDATAQLKFDELLDAGLDMENYEGAGCSILYVIRGEYSTIQLVSVPFFISRGLSNFASHTNKGAWFNPDAVANLISIPFTIHMVGKIAFECGKEELRCLLQLLVLFEGLGVGRSVPLGGPEVNQLRRLGSSLAGQVFTEHEKHLRSPLSLQQCARVAIRNQISCIRFRMRLAQLPLPSTIKSYVSCYDMPDISPAYDFEALWSLSGSQSEFDWNLIQ